MSRQDTRPDYRHFPSEYSDLLYQYARDGQATLGPMPRNAALSARRDMYRFKMFLMHGIDADPEDAHCRALLAIAVRAVIHVEPVATEEPTGTHMLVVTTNPIVAAMQAIQNAKE